MSMIRRVFAALIAVSALAFNNVSHAETPDSVKEGQPGLIDQITEQTRSNIRSLFGKLLTPQMFAKELECLARNIFYEAASEPEEGKVAVGLVTLNRVEDGRFADSVCKVVHQPRQFSWVSERPRRPQADDPRWIESQRIARELVTSDEYDILRVKYGTALYFHNHTVRPAWVHQKRRVSRIGLHTFYAERNSF